MPGITYSELVQTRARYEQIWFQNDNVSGIGIVKDEHGNFAIEIGLIDFSLAHAYPQSIPVIKADGTEGDEHVQIKVIELGKVELLGAQSQAKAILENNTQKESIFPPGGNRSRERPCPGGYSISHHGKYAAGTYGLLIRNLKGSAAQRKKRYILSNNHVMALHNSASIGDPILQPGRLDGGSLNRDGIASLTKYIKMYPESQRVNFADAAIANVNNTRYVTSRVEGIGWPLGEKNAHGPEFIKSRVQMSGRTSGYTTGRIESTNYIVRIQGTPIGTVKYDGQIATTPMSNSGDSGAGLFEYTSSHGAHTIGLSFAVAKRQNGQVERSFFNHISDVLEGLQGWGDDFTTRAAELDSAKNDSETETARGTMRARLQWF